MTKHELAGRVKEARKGAKLTQEALGMHMGKSKQYVCELEKGNITLTYLMACTIAQACAVDLDFFSNQSPV